MLPPRTSLRIRIASLSDLVHLQKPLTTTPVWFSLVKKISYQPHYALLSTTKLFCTKPTKQKRHQKHGWRRERPRGLRDAPGGPGSGESGLH